LQTGPLSASPGVAAARGVCYTIGPVPTPKRARGAGKRHRPGRRAVALEQLAFDLGPERPRWRLSRLVLRSRHRERILERLEFVRRFFPELEDCTVRVGLARKPGVLGWGSLDPDDPGVWIRPRSLAYFTIAHELTHLLQARGLVPTGERACDLWALARSPMIVDSPPSYLRLPRELRERSRLSFALAVRLCDLARLALAARDRGDRTYLQSFEKGVALEMGGAAPRSARRRVAAAPARAGILQLALRGATGRRPAPVRT
jgi:hypothetical protein